LRPQVSGDSADTDYGHTASKFFILEDGMDIRIKRAMAAAGIATALALPLSSQASDGTITFNGTVTANTCAVSVNSGANGVITGGHADATVLLPTVSTAALTGAAATGATAAKTTAAGTFFNMTLSACVATNHDVGALGTGTPAFVNIYFEAGPNVDVLTGGLINTTVAGGSTVEVKLYNASSASIVTTQIFPGTNTGQNPTGSGLSPASGGTQYYYAGYATPAGTAANAGIVSTSVTYSLVYQ
jgi:major type 1 subunit fimbrin (pilin)